MARLLQNCLFKSGSLIVSMVQPAESIVGHDTSSSERRLSVVRRSLPQSEMCSILVVITDVLRKQPLQMSLVHGNHVIQ